MIEVADIIILFIVFFLFFVAIFLVKIVSFSNSKEKTKSIKNRDKYFIAFSGKIYNLSALSEREDLFSNISLSPSTFKLFNRIFKNQINRGNVQSLYHLFKNANTILELEAKLKGILLQKKHIIDGLRRYLGEDDVLLELRMDRYENFHSTLANKTGLTKNIMAQIAYLRAKEYFSRFLFSSSKNVIEYAISLEKNDPKFYNLLSKIHLMQKEPIKIFNNAQKALTLATKTKNNLELAEALLYMAKYCLAKGMGQKAFAYCTSSEKIVINVEDENTFEKSCNYLFALGKLFYDLGYYENAKNSEMRALVFDAKKTTRNALLTIDILLALSNSWYKMGNNEKAKKYLKRSHELINQFLGTGSRRLAQKLNLEAKVFEAKCKYQESAISYLKANNIIKFSLGVDSVFYTVNNLDFAELNKQNRDIEGVKNVSLEAINIDKTLSSSIKYFFYSMDFCYAKAYFNLNRYSEALTHLRIERERSKKYKFIPRNGEIYLLQGDIYFKLKRSKEALESYETALRIYENLPVSIGLIEGYIKMAKLLSKNKKLSKSNILLNRANKALTFLNNEETIYKAIINRGLTENYEKMDNIFKAIEHSNRTLDTMINLFGDTNITIIDDYENLSTLWLKAGNFKKSNFYLQRTVDISSKLLGKDNQRTVRLAAKLSGNQ